MPRIRAGINIEVHYASPSDLVGHMDPWLEKDSILLEGVSATVDTPREILIHVPWLGRQISLKASPPSPETVAKTSPDTWRLSDGPHDTLDELRELVNAIRSGNLLQTQSTLPAEKRLRLMSPNSRALLAAKADAEERSILSRDHDPRVVEFLLKNPSLGLEEVRRLASRLTLNHAHFSIMMRNPVWMSDEPLRSTLARNPRLPEFLAERVLLPMATPVLKKLAEGVNTVESTRRVAVRILTSRGITVGARRGAF